jgi:S-methylmethionine-dependent homocysteine/selenocysteine methylase
MIILDGGLGRQLEAMGAPFRQPEWSALALMEAHHYVGLAHDAFIEAGAGVIATNSYALVPFHIGEKQFAAEGEKLIKLSGKLARAAADAAAAPVLVAASIPPMFGSYRPELFEPVTGKNMMLTFRRALRHYVDLFAAETFGCIAEVRCFIEVFRDAGKPLWVSVSLEDERPMPGRPMLRSGETLEALLHEVYRPDRADAPEALLFNCSQPEVMEDAIRTAAAYFDRFADRPLIGVYANAFPLVDETYAGANADLHEIRADLTPESYADFAERWAAAGATIIGGCCGISPDHIRVLKQRLAADA